MALSAEPDMRPKARQAQILRPRGSPAARLAALTLLPLIMPLIAVLWCVVVPLQGRPFLYRSERMRSPTEGFELLKIRTMNDHCGAILEPGAPGGHDGCRITPVGRILRRYRLDELPQIFNVLRGDMGFIGPRPPLRRHVDACPRVYNSVLADLPGITGLATVMVHQREERLLSRCRSAAETEAVYRSRCILLKARLDSIYSRNRSLALDIFILWRTLLAVVPQPLRRSSPKHSSAHTQDLQMPQSLRTASIEFPIH